MEKRNYWLDLFTASTWKEFKEAGGTISGFRKRMRKMVQKIEPGDYLLCYLTGVSRFIGVLEVTSKAFEDNTPIWKDEDFPMRLNVKILSELTPETAIPVSNFKNSLNIFKNLSSKRAWTGHFRSSPTKYSQQDGETIVKAMSEAVKKPTIIPVDERKLKYRPKSFRAKIGQVTVPDSDTDLFTEKEKQRIPSEHTEIQWLLLNLGSDMGFDVWVARNDRNRDHKGNKFSKISGLISELPLQFDDATNKTIELIDVLWLKGKAIISAFEIESTTSIYSGLLRMSDLIAMQPNITIPLYLVAPDDKREKVLTEVNRPTFSKLNPPLSEICRFISFTVLKDQIDKIGSIINYVKPEYLEKISESCSIE
jgi:predicted RNA-binding protein